MAEYKEFQNTFEGLTITLRHYFAKDAILIKLDDNFAKANGFRSMEEIYQTAPRMRGREWLDTKLIEQAHKFEKQQVS